MRQSGPGAAALDTPIKELEAELRRVERVDGDDRIPDSI